VCSSDLRGIQTNICVLPKTAPEKGLDDVVCTQFGGLASFLVRWGDAVAFTTLEDEENLTTVNEARLRGGDDIAITTKLKSQHSIFKRNGKMFEVRSQGNASALFWAYHSLTGQQLGEAFSFGGNGLGRLSWNNAYRLRLMADIVFTTEDTQVKDHLQETVERLLSHANKNGRYPGYKYSADKTTPLQLIALDGAIYSAFLYALPLLDNIDQKRVLKNAADFFKSAEKQWNGNFYRSALPRWTSHNAPFNQQNVLGLAMVLFANFTRSKEYDARIAKLFDNMTNAITEGDEKIF